MADSFSSMNIAVDIDDVLANYMEQFLDFQKERYGRRLHFEDCDTYSLKTLFQMTEQEEVKQIHEFHKSQYFENIKPLPSAQESLQELKAQEHTLYVITSRQNHIAEKTRKWIDRYFPGIFEDVFITNEASLDKKHVKKIDVCKQINANTIIEDSPSNANDAARERIQAVLMDKPWNQMESEPEGLYRMNNWSEALSVLLNN